MQTARRRLLQALLLARSLPPSSSLTTFARRTAEPFNRTPDGSLPRATLRAPWAAIQTRGAKVLGSDVLKAQHTQHGRGAATIQVELRDVDSGNKITEKFHTDEAIERESFTYLYQEGDSVTLMKPSTFEQLEVPKELFGKGASYLKDGMTVTLQYYDGKPMSASVPHRVTCTVVEAQPNAKGLTATPQYKRVVLDNGLTVLAPPFVEAVEKIIINTTDDSYITRA